MMTKTEYEVIKEKAGYFEGILFFCRKILAVVCKLYFTKVNLCKILFYISHTKELPYFDFAQKILVLWSKCNEGKDKN